MATVEEIQILKEVRRQFSRRPLDITRLELTYLKGTVYMAGSIGVPREETSVIAKDEIADVILILQKNPGIKQIVMGCKIKETPKKEVKHIPGSGH